MIARAAVVIAGVAGVLAIGSVLAAPSPKPSPKAHGGFVADLDCASCHTEDGWRLSPNAGASGFDHDRTGFPLRGKHAQSTCGMCHRGAQPATSCEGCHRDPHAGRHDEGCAECHTAVAWSDTNTLEQHRRTRMPLTGRHAVVDCTACHRRQGGRTFSDLPTDCYACHRDRYRDPAVHPTHDGSTGAAPFPRACGLCHQTTAWSPAFTDPNALPRQAIARSGRHDPWFVLSSGSHRAASCTSCHIDNRRLQQVRCDGCHDDGSLRAQHRGVSQPRVAPACLRCHPRGSAR